jgi:PAS domain S-box-containing protein
LLHSEGTEARAGKDADAYRESARRAVLAASAEAVAQVGSWDWDLTTDELLWSDNHYRLLGLEPGEIAPTLEYIFDHAHPDDRERIERGIDAARDAGVLAPWEFRLIRADGAVRHFHSRQAVVEHCDGEPRRMIGTLQDITERRLAEREIAAHVAVSDALSTWEGMDPSGERLLRSLAEAMEFERGALLVPQGDALVVRAAWQAHDAAAFRAGTRGFRLPYGVGVAGRAWELRTPVHLRDLHHQAPHVRRQYPVAEGVRGAVAVPALHGREVVAVVSFGSREEVELTERLIRSLTGIGYELGEFLSRRRGELNPPGLTARELQVLQLAGQGCSGPMIAERLCVSPATVRTHFENVYAKYGVRDRASAVAKALREGLIE